jgi:TetR/AcrR family transcriptional regulator, cholesterol catabolism regulator
MPDASGIARRRTAAQRNATLKSQYRQRRAEIIQVAAEVFRAKGFDAATMNDIAKGVGSDRASVYYYVKNKEECLEEIVRDVLRDNLLGARRVLAQDANGAEKIGALVQDMISSYDRNFPHMYVFLEDFPRIARQRDRWARDIMAMTQEFEAMVSEILVGGQADGSLREDLPVRLSALAMFGMVNWTYCWYQPGGRHDPAAIASAFSAILLGGLARR